MNGVSLAAEMANAADSWLLSLTADQREAAQYPGPERGDQERTTWFYTPTDHGGLPLNRQRPRQQQLAMGLLAAGLSARAYAVAAIVMGLENVLDRQESWSRDWGRDVGATRECITSGCSAPRATAPGGGAAAAITCR
jgi:Protein of unknown function (DUF3500)